MAVNTKVDICNMTLALLGNLGSVNNIDTPETDVEKVFALWYDVTRRTTLKLLMPNFCLARKIVSKINITPVSGFPIAYEYPNDCLKVQGLNDIDQKDFEYTIESKPGGGNAIYVPEEYEDGLPVRYVKDITDVNSMSDEFKVELAFELAPLVALPVTQDPTKAALALKQLPEKKVALSGINAQENPPIRVTRSRFRAARYANLSSIPSKR